VALKDLMSMFQSGQQPMGPESPEDLYDPSEFEAQGEYIEDAHVNPLWGPEGESLSSQWGMAVEDLQDTPTDELGVPENPQGDFEALAQQLQQVRDGDKAYQNSVLERNKTRDKTAAKTRGGGY
jgi:hypothetical protein